jgi:putative DNA methylase
MRPTTTRRRLQPIAADNKWHCRGYLPHFDDKNLTHSITIRLADSLPNYKLELWKEELSLLAKQNSESELYKLIEDCLDRGSGSNWLQDPQVADIVEKALLFFDQERYQLHAWTIMPNHVHALLTLHEAYSLSTIVHSWKSFTANKANAILHRTGAFWQAEYFDRFIRSDRHFQDTCEYIENNPVKAGLCDDPQTWQFGSARRRLEASAT